MSAHTARGNLNRKLAVFGSLALAGGLLADVAEPVVAQAAQPEEDDRPIVEEVKNAYEESDATGHRLVATSVLNDLHARSGSGALALHEALTEVVAERGADGLESLLLSSTAAIAANPELEPAQLEAAVGSLLEVYWVAGQARPHQFLPLSRPGLPTVHHLRAAHVRTALETMLLDPGANNIDEALNEGVCSEAGLADVEARYGEGVRAQIEEICGSMGAGALGGLGSTPGLPEGLSHLDCLGEHEPTRAERVQQLMVDCYESLQEGGGSPIADSADGGSASTTSTTSGASETATLSGSSSSSTSDATETATLSGSSSTTEGEPLEAQQSIPYDQIKYTRFKKNADGSVEIVHELYNGTKIQVKNEDFGSNTHDIFTNMAPGTEKIIVESAVRRTEQNNNGGGSNSPGPGQEGSTEPCNQLSLELQEIDAETFSGEGPPLDPTINPPPGDPDGLVEELDCFSVAGETNEVDLASLCFDELVHCDIGEAPDADCNCQPTRGPLPPDIGCMLVMICADGVLPDENCRCGDAEEVEFVPVVDGGRGPGPGPDPVPLATIIAALPTGEGGHHYGQDPDGAP